MESALSLSARVAKGAAWMVMMRWTVRVLGFVNTIIVARILMPEDYGIVAIAILIYGSIEVFGQFGFNLYLLRKVDITTAEMDTIWSLSIIRGVLCSLIMIAFAVPAAGFFDDPRVTDLILLLAIVPILDGLQNIGMIKFERELRFSTTFLFDVSKKVALVFFSITLAIILKNYWALAISILIQKVIGLMLSFIISSYRPTWTLSRWKNVFHFSKWILFNNVAIFLRNNVDNFLVAKFMGPSFMGIYSIARELAELGTTEIVAPVSRALLPGFARVADDLESLQTAYLRTLSLMIGIGLPVGIGLGLIADPFVKFALGEKWLPVVPVLQLLAIYGAVRTGYAAAGSIFLVRNRPQYDAYLATGTFILGTPLLIAGIHFFGSVGVACAMIVISFFGVIGYYTLAVRLLNLPFRAAGKWIWRSVVSTAIMAIIVYSLDTYVHSLFPLLRLTILACVGAAVYVGVHLILWRLSGMPFAAETEIIRLLRPFFHRYSRSL